MIASFQDHERNGHRRAPVSRKTVACRPGLMFKIDFRKNLPMTVWGEKIVMRVLDNTAARMNASDLGFPANLPLEERVREALRHAHRHRLTGSGKSN